jgi:IS30 family transposase
MTDPPVDGDLGHRHRRPRFNQTTTLKSSGLSVHTAESLTAMDAELNNRPRKILGWKQPPNKFLDCSPGN